MLEVIGLRRRFGDVVALDGVSFTAEPGQLLGFLGANGAGKTTTMRSIMGVSTPDEGDVAWKGHPVDRLDRLGFGYMPEERGLYPRMRVLDQLVYMAELHGMTRAQAHDSASAWLDRLGLGERGEEQLQHLSHGNQQRVQLAAAVVHDPEVLLLDEPFSGLDPVAVDALAAILVELAGRGKVVVFSSHQLDLVEDLCETVTVLDRGQVVACGQVRDLKRATGIARRLRVVLTGGAASRSWADGLSGVTVLSGDRDVFVLELDSRADPAVVLDAAAKAGHVEEFSLELPHLSQLFRAAVNR